MVHTGPKPRPSSSTPWRWLVSMANICSSPSSLRAEDPAGVFDVRQQSSRTTAREKLDPLSFVGNLRLLCNSAMQSIQPCITGSQNIGQYINGKLIQCRPHGGEAHCMRFCPKPRLSSSTQWWWLLIMASPSSVQALDVARVFAV